MHRYAGVTVLSGETVLLVREPDYFSHDLHWGLPSGRVEVGESPEAGAVRELAEEAGCSIAVDDLDLVSVTIVECDGKQLSMSHNYAATMEIAAELWPNDPDGLVTDAQWIPRPDALDHLAVLTYAPIREPAVRSLQTGDRGLTWTFRLLDANARVPEFQWDDPIARQPVDER